MAVTINGNVFPCTIKFEISAGPSVTPNPGKRIEIEGSIFSDMVNISVGKDGPSFCVSAHLLIDALSVFALNNDRQTE